MTRVARFQAKVDYINKQLGTKFEIDNFPQSGGRTLITIGDNGGETKLNNNRMKPAQFDMYLTGMVDLLILQQRLAQGLKA